MSGWRSGAVTGLVLLTAGCGGSGDGGSGATSGDPVAVSGSLDAGYTVAAVPGIVDRGALV